MFIRKRTYQSKRHGFTESYQVIETYREGGKVKQRYICNLGSSPTPEAALERTRQEMKREYERLKYGTELHSKESFEGSKFEKDVLSIWAKRIENLEYVVSRVTNAPLDTTKGPKPQSLAEDLRTKLGLTERDV